MGSGVVGAGLTFTGNLGQDLRHRKKLEGLLVRQGIHTVYMSMVWGLGFRVRVKGLRFRV